MSATATVSNEKKTKTRSERPSTNQNGPRLRDRIIGYSVHVEMSNPNGEIDTGGPRIISNGHCIMSPFAVKRKLRDLMLRNDETMIAEFSNGIKEENRQIFESEFRGFIEQKPVDAANSALHMAKTDPAQFLNRYIDARLFGALAISDMKTKKNDNEKDEEKNASRGKYEGCVQVSFPISVARVTPYTSSNAKKYTFQEKNIEKEVGTIAPDGIKVVEHAVLFGHIMINGHQAGENGATEADMDFLERLIPHMFDDRSAQRVNVHVVSAFSVSPDSKPYFPANQFHILRAMRPTVREGVGLPTDYSDYDFPTAESISEKFKGIKVVDLIG